jgi:LPS-assembly lipoprotein
MSFPAYRLSLLLVLALLLTACGFHLRGTHIDLGHLPQPLQLVGVDSYPALGRELRRQLREAGVRLDERAEGAGSVLRIADARSERRLLSLDARNRAAEYELSEMLRYSLRSGGRTTPQRTLRVTRLLLQPGDELLARQREERRLREEMRRELVRQLIQQLAAR